MIGFVRQFSYMWLIWNSSKREHFNPLDSKGNYSATSNNKLVD